MAPDVPQWGSPDSSLNVQQCETCVDQTAMTQGMALATPQQVRSCKWSIIPDVHFGLVPSCAGIGIFGSQIGTHIRYPNIVKLHFCINLCSNPATLDPLNSLV